MFQIQLKQDTWYPRPACGFVDPYYLLIQHLPDSKILMPGGSFETKIHADWIDKDFSTLPYNFINVRVVSVDDYLPFDSNRYFCVYLYRKEAGKGLNIFVSYNLWPTKENGKKLEELFGNNNWLYIGILRRGVRDNLDYIEALAKDKGLV